jgi:hypothetical protein
MGFVWKEQRGEKVEKMVPEFEGLNGTTFPGSYPQLVKTVRHRDGRNIRVLLVRGFSEGLKILHRLHGPSSPALSTGS